MTRRWVVLIATIGLIAALFAASPEQAAEVFKVALPFLFAPEAVP